MKTTKKFYANALRDEDVKRLVFYLKKCSSDMKAFLSFEESLDTDEVKALYLFSDNLVKETVDGILSKILPSSRVISDDCLLTFCYPLSEFEGFDSEELYYLEFKE